MQDSQEDESTVAALKLEIDEAWKKVQSGQDRETEQQSIIDKLKVNPRSFNTDFMTHSFAGRDRRSQRSVGRVRQVRCGSCLY